MLNKVKRVVKVRVNASGKRVIGYVDLSDQYNRISDILNGPETSFLVHLEETPSDLKNNNYYIIQKDAISYVEALEEPQKQDYLRQEGSFQPVTVELIEPNVQMQAELFVLQEKNVFESLNDSRPFINLRHAHFVDSFEEYKFLAVGKKQVILVKV